MPDAQELATLARLLGLEDFEVVDATWDQREKLRRFVLVPRTAVGLCPDCHAVTDQRHICHDREIADLPMGDQQVELVVRLWQFECGQCGRFFTPRFAALAEGAHATERLLERLAELAGHGDIASAARFFKMPEKTAEGWYYAYLKRRAEHQLVPARSPVRSLGIDELSLKKDTASSSAC
jgi:transposase